MTPSSRLLQSMFWGTALAILPLVIHAALWPLLVFYWGMLGTLATLDIIALSRKQPTLELEHPPSAYVGEPFFVKAVLFWPLRSRLPCHITSETQTPLLPGQEIQTWLYPGATEFRLPLQAPRRGEGQILALWIRLIGPFRLFHRILRIPCHHATISVVPSLPWVQRIALQHFGAWQYRGGVRLEHLPGDGSEFDALETYMPGHDLRNVDWKVSARHQQLRVRRFRIERNQRLILCLDTGRMMADSIHGLQRLDHAIHASLLLSYFALKAGDLVGMYAYDNKPHTWFPPAASIRHFQRLHLASASLRPSQTETNHVLGLHELLHKLNRRTLIVVFSDFADTTTAELMIENLQHLVQRHLVIFVALDDPLIETPLLQKPQSIEHVAQSLVAHDLRTERHRVLKMLQRQGIHVVHGPPDGAAVQLVARYIEIKRREMIG